MIPEHLYHIYNRGNNREALFFDQRNYLFFFDKIKKHMLPHVDILAYCLMPNHFHLMVYSKKTLDPGKFSQDLRVMLSSYTRAINNQIDRRGSLFQQNTKLKSLEDEDSKSDYPFICFQYIHQNPVKAGLTERFEDWEMSSFKDYAGMRDETICNKDLARELLDIPAAPEVFVKQAYGVQLIWEI
jgi:REP element-mobilizing transposase RayT